MAEFSAESHSSLDHIAVYDHSTAKAGADHGGDRSLPAMSAEDGEVSPKGPGITVVEVGDGAAQTDFELLADIESGPICMDEVGGAARTEDTAGTGGPGRVQTDGDDIIQ